MQYLDKLIELKNKIGNTPILKLTFSYKGQNKVVFAKEEFLNLSGSIKIRPAYQIIFDAIKSGSLKAGQRIAEVTSGNMGIALAYIARFIGNPITILMPKTMSEERKQIIRELGADIVLTEDFVDAFEKLSKFKEEGAYLPMQFDNISNCKAHIETANEILNVIDMFDAFVSGVGTGGTLIGCGGHLKEKVGCKLIAIDPAESGLLVNGSSKGKHKIQGLSDQIIPSIYKKELVDQIIEINSDDAIVMARYVKEKFNVGVGISSGANLLGAILSDYNKVVTVFSDDETKYGSTDLNNKNIRSNLVEDIKFISCEVI